MHHYDYETTDALTDGIVRVDTFTGQLWRWNAARHDWRVIA